MQFVLSEDEYKDLKSAADRGRRFEGHTAVGLTSKQLQKLCTSIADTMPVKWGWGSTPDPKPWGCLITAEADKQEWYCDKCPVDNLCPYSGKTYSK